MTSSRLARALFVVALCTPSSGFAASKEMIQLQTQIQQLQDAVARLQQSNDERMGVLKDLVQQSADSVNKLSLNLDAVQKQLATQTEAQGGKVDQVSGQVQAMNDSLDEVKARMNRLEKILLDVQAQQQSLAAGAAAAAPSSTVNTAPTGPASGPPAADTTLPTSPAPDATPARHGKPSAGTLPPMADTGAGSPAAQPADTLYKTALSDYMSAKYPLAASEFSDVSRSHPDSPLAGNALFYQGEIEYRAGHYAAAAKDYDHVLEQYPDNSKVPAAHLHKAQALIQLRQNDAGVRELRSLIQRFPNSPEAIQARSKLNGMGVPVRPRA